MKKAVSSETHSMIKTRLDALTHTYSLAEPLQRVAAQLYKRISSNALRSLSDGELYEALILTSTCLTQQLETAESETIIFQSIQDSSWLSVATRDSAFIVKSLQECLESSNIHAEVYLHPIINEQSQTVSVSCIKLGQITALQQDSLYTLIKKSLAQLRLVTEDFTKIVAQSSKVVSESTVETSEFLNWILADNVIFLGYASWKEQSTETVLGLFRDSSYYELCKNELATDAAQAKRTKSPLYFASLSSISLAYSHKRPLHVYFRTTENTAHSFLIIPSSKARSSRNSAVPLVREHLQILAEKENLQVQSHDYTLLRSTLDEMPLDEVLRLDPASLNEYLLTSLGQFGEDEIELVDLEPKQTEERGFTIACYLHASLFSNEALEQFLRDVENTLKVTAHSARAHIDSTHKDYLRIYVSLPKSSGELVLSKNIRLKKMRELATTAFSSWTSKVTLLAREDSSTKKNITQIQLLAFAAPIEYQNNTRPENAFKELNKLAQADQALSVSIDTTNEISDTLGTSELSVISMGESHALEKLFPILQDFGISILDIKSYKFEKLQLQKIRCKFNRPLTSSAHFEQFVAPCIKQVLTSQSASDPLNAVTLQAPLPLMALNILRGYAGLLSQLNKFATRHAIFRALAEEPTLCGLLYQGFEVLFDPKFKLQNKKRLEKFSKIKEDYLHQLQHVQDLATDRILRALLELLEHTLRTNAYANRDTLALKIHSEYLSIAPQPRPLYEVYVWGPKVEGIHLRSSKVSRGGIRWSDRRDDYRTEVLSLMKTQKIKNAVIVPTGAKGGFIVKQIPSDPALVKSAAEEAYKDYVRALLSIADNYSNKEIQTPPAVISYDSADPYFVVAADKGTATFSDIANGIARDEFNFWLGDAFASGGSKGYDHKKYGITARGAWESVQRHASELALDLNKPFTVVGLGDMAGDVFGNGLIYSKSICLIAAFNHKHIFIDPKPDPLTSFQARETLFKKAGSQWSDYPTDIFSQGGGIFLRTSKEIKLSQEFVSALGLDAAMADKSVSGEQLIQYILKAPVDILYNGGIGTYVKAEQESHADVNDSSNDRVRINGNELRAKIVAEGGNLGFTQKARVEYAKRGGRIHTDAIDNSGGVDLSDHEVNLKILLKDIVAAEKINTAERDVLISSLAQTVVKLVLKDNFDHALALSLSARRAPRNIEYHGGLIRMLHNRGYINRQLEALPEDEELQDRIRQGTGLLKPELAVVLAGAKLWLKSEILETKRLGSELGEQLLLEYFPKEIQERFSDNIKTHQLRSEIIATQIVNKCVNNLGVSFVYRISRNHSVPASVVAEAYLVAEKILGAEAIREEIYKLGNNAQSALSLSLYEELSRGLRAMTSWLTSRYRELLNTRDALLQFERPFTEMHDRANELLSKSLKATVERGLARTELQILSPNSQKTFALIPLIIPILEMIDIYTQSKAAPEVISKIYCEMLEYFRVSKLVMLSGPFQTASRWEKELRLLSLGEMRQGLRKLCVKILKSSARKAEGIDLTSELSQNTHYEGFKTTLEEFERSQESVAALAVLARQINQLST